MLVLLQCNVKKFFRHSTIQGIHLQLPTHGPLTNYNETVGLNSLMTEQGDTKKTLLMVANYCLSCLVIMTINDCYQVLCKVD